MNKHLLLFHKTQIPVIAPRPALALTGSLKNHNGGSAYSDYLTIENAVGLCSVRLISGSLPNTARIYVDNSLRRVYVKWSASSLGSSIQDVPDGDLEDSGKGWKLGTGLSISSTTSHSGTKSIVFRNHNGITEAISPSVNFGSTGTVTASCQIAQGASAKNNLTGRVFLEATFAGNVKTRHYGNIINSSSSVWAESTVSALISGDALSIAVGAELNRIRENKAAHVDSFEWDYSYIPGSTPATDYPITIEIKDEINRTAQWAGIIAEGAENGTFIEYLPVSVSQHSVFAGTSAATLVTIRDLNIAPCTGAVTNNVAGAYLQIDLGTAKEICTVVLGTGEIDGATIGGWSGRGGRIAYSNNLADWFEVTDCYQTTSVVESPPADFQVHFSPVTARYWRVVKAAGSSALRTSTFRLYGFVGGLTLATATFSQSSSFGGLIGSFANLCEIPNSLTTGAATGNTGTEWFKADLGSVKAVRRLVLCGGTLPGWGSAGTYLNGGTTYIQTSVDDITWTTPQPFTGVIADAAPAEHCCDITADARYVKVSRPGYLATTAFRVYALP